MADKTFTEVTAAMPNSISTQQILVYVDETSLNKYAGNLNERINSLETKIADNLVRDMKNINVDTSDPLINVSDENNYYTVQAKYDVNTKGNKSNINMTIPIPIKSTTDMIGLMLDNNMIKLNWNLNLQNGTGDNSLIQTVNEGEVANIARAKNAVVLGVENYASNTRSLTFGKINNNHGSNALVGGLRNVNAANHSFIIGQDNICYDTGYDSIIAGQQNENKYHNAIIVGKSNTNNGPQSIVGGLKNDNSAFNSVIGGQSNTSQEDNADIIVAGSNNNVNNSCSITSGVYNNNNSYCSLVVAQSSEDNPAQIANIVGAWAGGRSPIVGGTYGFAHGNFVIANYEYQKVFGSYNYNKSTTLLEIGNGTSDTARSNAFEVLRDGRAKVYGAPTESEDVVRKVDLENGIVSIYKYKGTVDTYNDLPKTANNGDVYNVSDSGQNYAWDGGKWDTLGATDYVTLDTQQVITGNKIFMGYVSFGNVPTTDYQPYFFNGVFNISSVSGCNMSLDTDKLDVENETGTSTRYYINRYGLGNVALGYYPTNLPTEDSLVKLSSTGEPDYVKLSNIVDTSSKQYIKETKIFREGLTVGYDTWDGANYDEDKITWTPDGGINYYTFRFSRQNGTLVVRPSDLPTTNSLLQISTTGNASYTPISNLVSVPTSSLKTYSDVSGVYEFKRDISTANGTETAATRYCAQGVYSSLGETGIGFSNGKLIHTDGSDDITIGIVPDVSYGYKISRYATQDYELGYLPLDLPTTNSVPVYSSTGAVSWEVMPEKYYKHNMIVNGEYEFSFISSRSMEYSILAEFNSYNMTNLLRNTLITNMTSMTMGVIVQKETGTLLYFMDGGINSLTITSISDDVIEL